MAHSTRRFGDVYVNMLAAGTARRLEQRDACTSAGSNASSTSCIEPACVRVGGLFPIFQTAQANFAADSSGIKRLSAFYMALQEINNKTDGIADDLLPNTVLRFAIRDSKRDPSSAFFGALALTREVFGTAGVRAIVGAASSGSSKNAALVTKQAHVPQISYSSTSGELSDGLNYDYFLRTPPSDAFQAEGIADILKSLFGFGAVATVASTDTYGAMGIAEFLSSAANHSLTVLTSQSFAINAADFSAQYRELKRSGAHVIVLFCQASDAGRFLKGAYEAGIGGPGYLWFGSDAVTKSDTWLNDGVLADEVLRLQVLKGYFGMRPTTGRGTARYEAYMARMRAMPPTDGDDGACNLQTDDDGGFYLWAQDHDGNASTPLKCAGSDNQDEGSYAPYAYDATYAIAHALHALIEEQGAAELTGAALRAALVQTVDFEGVTGRITFHDCDADAACAASRWGHGDRKEGVYYEVLNYQPAANGVEEGLVQVAAWTPRANSRWEARWDAAGFAPLVFSTADNSQPLDVLQLACTPGHVVASGASGFAECVACAAGKYEVNNAYCQEAEPTEYIPANASNASGVFNCTSFAPNTRVQALGLDSRGGPVMESRYGAQRPQECVCVPGTFLWNGACVACPDGGRCLGGAVAPVAKLGYGRLAWSESETDGAADAPPLFFRCKNHDACVDGASWCDCPGGVLNVSGSALRGWAVTSEVDFTCADGYRNGSSLCSRCEPGYGQSDGQCAVCGSSPALYAVRSLLLVLLWFPALRSLLRNYVQSAYSSIAFIQFVGIYASFGIPWDGALQAFYAALGTFNLNLDALHIACSSTAGGLSFRDVWVVQMLLPLLFPITALLHVLVGMALTALARRRLPPTGLLVRLGWRPRTSFTCAALVSLYLPPGLFFLNMYYMMGVSTSFKMLACSDDGQGGQFLRADPSTRCWRGAHVGLALGALAGVLLYLVCVPCLYCWVLFSVLPAQGRKSHLGKASRQLGAALVVAFSFLYGRFEAHLWFWELLESFRKVVFVAITVFGSAPLNKSVGALGAVVALMMADIYNHPFNVTLYDWLEEALAFAEFLLLLFGLVVLYRADVAAAEARDGAGGALDWEQLLAWCVMLGAFVIIVYVSAVDLDTVWQKRRCAQLRRATKCQLTAQLFVLRYLDDLLPDWAAQAPAAQIANLRDLERQIMRALYGGKLKLSHPRAHQCGAQLAAIPYLLDSLVQHASGALPVARHGITPRGGGTEQVLEAYLDCASSINPFRGAPSALLFAEPLRGALVWWLNDPDKAPVRQRLHAFLKDLHAYARRREQQMGVLLRLKKAMVVTAGEKVVNKEKLAATRELEKTITAAQGEGSQNAQRKASRKASARKRSRLNSLGLPTTLHAWPSLFSIYDEWSESTSSRALQAELLDKLKKQLGCERVLLLRAERAPDRLEQLDTAKPTDGPSASTLPSSPRSPRLPSPFASAFSRASARHSARQPESPAAGGDGGGGGGSDGGGGGGSDGGGGGERVSCRHSQFRRRTPNRIKEGMWSLAADSPAGTCVSSKAPVMVDDAWFDPRFGSRQFASETLSQLCVPIFEHVTPAGQPSLAEGDEATGDSARGGDSARSGGSARAADSAEAVAAPAPGVKRPSVDAAASGGGDVGGGGVVRAAAEVQEVHVHVEGSASHGKGATPRSPSHWPHLPHLHLPHLHLPHLHLPHLGRRHSAGPGEVAPDERVVVGVLKCLNKTDPTTSRTGYAFSLDDADTAALFAALIAECSCASPAALSSRMSRRSYSA